MKYTDAEITELVRQIMVTASGVAIDYVPPDLPVVIKIKEQLKSFLEAAE